VGPPRGAGPLRDHPRSHHAGQGDRRAELPVGAFGGQARHHAEARTGGPRCTRARHALGENPGPAVERRPWPRFQAGPARRASFERLEAATRELAAGLLRRGRERAESAFQRGRAPEGCSESFFRAFLSAPASFAEVMQVRPATGSIASFPRRMLEAAESISRAPLGVRGGGSFSAAAPGGPELDATFPAAAARGIPGSRAEA